METVLDIYTKLIIAIISFIAPLIIHLLSVFNDGIAVVRRRYDEESRQMNNLLKKEIIQTPEGGDLGTIVSVSNEAFKKRQKDNAAKLKLLAPKRQIKRIFPTLFCSLAFIMIYKTAECNNLCSGFWLILLLVISVVAAIIGVWFLKNVTWAVIDVREEIVRDKEGSGQKSERITITPVKAEKEND